MSPDSPNFKEELSRLVKKLKPVNERAIPPTEIIQDLNDYYGSTLKSLTAFKKEEWEKYYGLSGVPVYNYLNPAPQPSITGVKRAADAFEWKVKDFQNLEYNPESPLFELDTEYLDASGLHISRKLVLYCREAFHKQFQFLQNDVIEKGHLGWILGPPGTGKSTTALAFASTLNSKEWIVTWIHLSRWERPMCVRYEGGMKKTSEIDIRDPMLTDLDNILFDVDSSSKHLLFVDGYALNGQRHIDVEMTCHSWLKENRDIRRLVFICSMSSRGKANLQEDQGNKVKVHFVYSWTLEEYLAAVQYENFFENVKHNLDAGEEINNELAGQNVPAEIVDVPQPFPEDLIYSKFYFAGGSARFMFLFNTSKIINYLEESVDYVPDIMPYITGSIGYTSDAVINRLFSIHLQEDRKKISVISEWAASQLAIKRGA